MIFARRRGSPHADCRRLAAITALSRNGGRTRGSPRFPSNDSRSAVSSPHMYAPAPGARDRKEKEVPPIREPNRPVSSASSIAPRRRSTCVPYRADIDIACFRAHGIAHDCKALKYQLRAKIQKNTVFEAQRLGFIGVQTTYFGFFAWKQPIPISLPPESPPLPSSEFRSLKLSKICSGDNRRLLSAGNKPWQMLLRAIARRFGVGKQSAGFARAGLAIIGNLAAPAYFIAVHILDLNGAHWLSLTSAAGAGRTVRGSWSA